jgi:hypothetical protein
LRQPIRAAQDGPIPIYGYVWLDQNDDGNVDSDDVLVGDIHVESGYLDGPLAGRFGGSGESDSTGRYELSIRYPESASTSIITARYGRGSDHGLVQYFGCAKVDKAWLANRHQVDVRIARAPETANGIDMTGRCGELLESGVG